MTQSGAGHHGYLTFQQRTKNYWRHPNVLWASFLSLLSGTRIHRIVALENHFIDHICAFQRQLPPGHIFFREGASAAYLIAPTCLYVDSGSSQLGFSVPMDFSSRLLLALCSPLDFHDIMLFDFPFLSDSSDSSLNTFDCFWFCFP